MIIKCRDFSRFGVVIHDGGSLLVDPKEQVVRDLHIGTAFRIPGDANRHEMPLRMFLKPNDCILFETAEELTVPAEVFGVVVSRASLAAEGIIVANLKVDPQFNGRLTITVINAGKRSLRVDKGMPFSSVYFQTMEHPADGHISRAPPLPRALPTDWYRARLRSLLPFLLTFGASVAASLVAAYLFLLVQGVWK